MNLARARGEGKTCVFGCGMPSADGFDEYPIVRALARAAGRQACGPADCLALVSGAGASECAV
ncbi:hypothetical protein [Nocardia ninae]|uniref:Uncharacterized protein n=1 Tax=Nocardia ninae NBRC 108245 TaxID=1210091 RepID=A0A511MBD3_9NOCA|nr:hypothetical protein [Nocardia ninae]GEM37973.1 hypothetical protein NN4_24920 [Nocardia ninae NBRC 108245]